mmetsp:Transcript_20293/g.42304  ORF Transcript_20293/g.42304 Transcript_20293/m.42304 type:complete len:150 (+) Transcript_20293:130-579(+)
MPMLCFKSWPRRERMVSLGGLRKAAWASAKDPCGCSPLLSLICAFKVEWMTMEGNTSTCCAGGADTLEKYVLGIIVGVAVAVVVAVVVRLIRRGESSSPSRRKDANEGNERDAKADADRDPAEDMVSRRAAKRRIMVEIWWELVGGKSY